MDDSDFIKLFEAEEELAQGRDHAIKDLIPLMESKQDIDGTPVLFIVAGGEHALDYLMAKHPHLLAQEDLNGFSLLHTATAGGSDVCFEKVLAFFAQARRLNAKDRNGLSPLAIAAKLGNAHRTGRLIAQGAEVASPLLKSSPWYQAVINIHGEDAAMDCLRVIRDSGNTITADEQQALLAAARSLGNSQLEHWLQHHLDTQ